MSNIFEVILSLDLIRWMIHQQQLVEHQHRMFMRNPDEVRHDLFDLFVASVVHLGHSQMNKAPKSLREWHEQPVNLLEQPSLEKVNVQILSPNHDRVTNSFSSSSLFSFHSSRHLHPSFQSMTNRNPSITSTHMSNPCLSFRNHWNDTSLFF